MLEQTPFVRPNLKLSDSKANKSLVISTNSAEINQSYIFKPKFQKLKNKKDIVTFEALQRELEKKLNLN